MIHQSLFSGPHEIVWLILAFYNAFFSATFTHQYKYKNIFMNYSTGGNVLKYYLWPKGHGLFYSVIYLLQRLHLAPYVGLFDGLSRRNTGELEIKNYEGH